MSDNEKLIELLRKLKALAEQGEGGERDNAQRMLEQQMKKHNINLEDIDTELKKEVEFFLDPTYKQFFHQIVYSVCGFNETKIFIIRGDKRKLRKYLVLCTKSEAIEIGAKFDFYLPIYKKQQDIFYSAFIQKNHLYNKPTNNQPEREQTQEELEKIQEILKMMRGMKAHCFNKQIENK